MIKCEDNAPSAVQYCCKCYYKKPGLELISVKDMFGWLFLSFWNVQPISEEFQNGEGFGYIVAFRANGTRGWKERMVTSADSTTYKYRDETFPPLTPFEVKVGVYNNKGDGPFSKEVIIRSAEGGELTFVVALFLHEQRRWIILILPFVLVSQSQGKHHLMWKLTAFLHRKLGSRGNRPILALEDQEDMRCL